MRSLTTSREHFLAWRVSRTRRDGDCLLWTKSTNPKGYGHGWYDGGFWDIHKLTYTALIGPVPDGDVVRHSCDRPPCCEEDHLLLGSYHDNVMDMMDRGRCRSPVIGMAGDLNPAAKLSSTAVAEAAQQFLSGSAVPELAMRLGVSDQAIYEAFWGNSWADAVDQDIRTQLIAKLQSRRPLRGRDGDLLSLWETGRYTQRELAVLFGSSQSGISFALRRSFHTAKGKRLTPD